MGEGTRITAPTGWRKASYAQPRDGCAEIGHVGEGDTAQAAVRDTKNKEQGHFAVPPHQWAFCIGKVKRGEYNL